MATSRYVRPSLGSGGSGTTANPYGTVAAAYAAATAGDTIFIDTTTGAYKPTAQVQDTKGLIWRPWIGTEVLVDASDNAGTYVLRLEAAQCDCANWRVQNVGASKFAFRINANIAGFADIVVENGAGTGVVTGSGISTAVTAYRVTCRRLNQGWFIDSITGTMNLHACYSHDLTTNDRFNSPSGTLNVHHGTFAGNSAELWSITAGAANFYGCLFIGGGKTDSRDLVTNSGAAAVNVYSGAATYTVLDTTPFSEGWRNTGAGSLTVNANVQGQTAGIGRLFATPRRAEACLCFVRDDLEDYVTGGAFAGEWNTWLSELESRGFRGTYNISSREGDNVNSTSAAGWRDVAEVVKRGHDLATQGATGFQLANTDWLSVQYVGAGASCRLVIENNTVKTYVAGVLDVNKDIGTAPYKLSDLIAYLDGLANYTAVLSTLAAGASDASPAAARWLRDCDIADIKTAPVTLRCSPARVFAGELLANKQDIIDYTGYVPRTHIYSAGSYNGELAALMKANGWYGGRLGANPVAGYSTVVYKFRDDPNYDPFQGSGILCGTFIDTTSTNTIKRSVHAICQWAMWHGARIVLYGHAYSEFSQASWAAVFDAVLASGIPVKTLRDMYGENVSPSTQATDDSWAPILDSTSVAVACVPTRTTLIDRSGASFKNPPSAGCREFNPGIRPMNSRSTAIPTRNTTLLARPLTTRA